MVILDTSVIIDHLRQPGTRSLLERFVIAHPKETLAMSVISIQELYEGQSTKPDGKEKDMLSAIAPLRVLPYTYEIAEEAGKLARDLRYPIEFADAAIAATALVHGFSLFTLNKKHFEGILALELV